MTALVSARGVRRTFRGPGPWPWSPPRAVEALRGVDLELGPGEVVALVGRSGSGKTTLARIVLGLEEPDAGEVWLEGRRWDGLPESARRPLRPRYQYVPQDAAAALDPQQTVREHVEETLRVLARRPVDRARAEAEGLLDRLGLLSRADALPRDLSGGEQRRVTLARVLALAPRLVVADEPTAGLDPARRAEALADLRAVLDPTAGLLLVTHDLDAVASACHRAVVLLDGAVVEVVDLRSAAPAHPYTRALLDPWGANLEGEP